MKKFIAMFVLILVIIMLVIGLGYSCKIIVNKNNEIGILTQENNDLKNTITTLNNTIEKLQDTDNEKEEVKDEGSDVSFLFDESKLLNKDEKTKVTQEISDSMSVLSISVDTENNTLILDLDKQLAKLIYGYTGESESHTIAGFSQRINDAQVAIVGTTLKDLKAILLMEDGTIKSIGIDNILDKSYTVKTISEEKDYVKIIKVVIKDEEKADVKYGIVGIKKDGTSKIINF